jgi:hypothetical protein
MRCREHLVKLVLANIKKLKNSIRRINQFPRGKPTRYEMKDVFCVSRQASGNKTLWRDLKYL